VKGVSDIAELLTMGQTNVPSSRRRGANQAEGMNREELEKLAIDLEQEMLVAAEELRFEYAARLRDEIRDLRRELASIADAGLS
jgi:excinuclease ABC subunit B